MNDVRTDTIGWRLIRPRIAQRPLSLFSWMPWTIRPTPPCSPSQLIIVASDGARTSDAHHASVKTQVRSFARGSSSATSLRRGTPTWITGNVSPEKSMFDLITGSRTAPALASGTTRPGSAAGASRSSWMIGRVQSSRVWPASCGPMPWTTTIPVRSGRQAKSRCFSGLAAFASARAFA